MQIAYIFYLQLKKIRKQLKFFYYCHKKRSHLLSSITYEEALKKLTQFRPINSVNLCENDLGKIQENILLSIIIPVYNSEKSIDECLNSIINQKLSDRYEVICIDDGSMDNSLKILKKYEKNNNNIHIYSQKNSGASSARNFGLSKARGKYICFVDSDDFLPDNSINLMIKVAKQTNADIVTGMVGKYIERLNHVLYPRKISQQKIVETNNLIKMCNLTQGTPWGKLYKRELWSGVKFFEKYSFEDTIIFLNIYTKVKKFAYINSPIYCFRSSESSLFKKQKNSTSTIDSLWIVIKCNDLYFSQNGKINSEYIQLLIWHLSVVMYGRLKNLKYENILEYCFVIVCHFFNNMHLNNREFNFVGKNAKIYAELLHCFNTKDYGNFLSCCHILEESTEK